MKISRRTFLQGIAALGGGLQAACSSSDPFAAQAAAKSPGVPGDGLLHELPPQDPLVLVLRRTRFGFTHADYEAAQAQGIAAYLDDQLAMTEAGVVDMEADAQFPATTYPAAVTMTNPEGGIPALQKQMQARAIFLAEYSPRQLFELLVEFWGNHFNVAANAGNLAAYKTVDDREVIRAHALGRFRDLLHASARSPAMIIYLDNVSNTKFGPNENYARELMELHTLGIGGGYTEQDIKEVARCFTGWSINNDTHLFQFRAAQHDDGPKTVLGQAIAPAGEAEGLQVLDLLAAHPSTARFVATKLLRRFVTDDPPASMVARLAQVFQDTDGDIPSLVRAVFQDPEFLDHADEKFHRPMEFIASAVAVLAPDRNGYYGPFESEALAAMGHTPFSWGPPDGYPDRASYWLSTTGLIGRWNFAARLAEARSGNDASYVQAIVGTAQTATSLVDLLAERLLHRPLWPHDRDDLVYYAGSGNPDRPLEGETLRDRAEAIAGLMLASPYFLIR